MQKYCLIEERMIGFYFICSGSLEEVEEVQKDLGVGYKLLKIEDLVNRICN